MENNNKKILTFSYLALAIVSGFSFGKLMEAVASIFPAFARYTNIDFVQHGVPVLLAFAIFLVLQLNKRVNEFCDEVVTEIKKIVWPSRKDTVAMTIVVCVLVVAAGFMLAVFDGVSGYVIGQIAKVPLP